MLPENELCGKRFADACCSFARESGARESGPPNSGNKASRKTRGVYSATLVSLARGSVLHAKPSLKLLANGIWDCDFSGVAFGLRSRRGIIVKIGDADESYELICAGATRKYARLAGDFSAVVDVAG